MIIFVIFLCGLSLTNDSLLVDSTSTIKNGSSEPLTNKGLWDTILFKTKQGTSKLKDKLLPAKSGSSEAQHFYANLFQIYDKFKPTTDPLTQYKTQTKIYHANYHDKTPIFTKEYLGGFLDVKKDELNQLKESHSRLLESLSNLKIHNLYSGDGIVYVGGGKYNWLVLLSIYNLRRLNCTLPVEIIIPTHEEYKLDSDLCDTVFPKLGAKCIVLPDRLGSKASKLFKFEGYQYKALALLISSFENVLLLDSDNMPLHDPSFIFNEEPFKSNGLVLWPDFWKRATSPYFYDIAGIKIDYTKRIRGINNLNDENEKMENIPFHDFKGTIPDPTTESGQILLKKSTHVQTILLSLYYNLFGPTHFYPLFSQGSDGEGDKETFIAAAVVLKQKFYQVEKFIKAFGYYDEKDGNFQGTAMGQYDPFQDYKQQLLKEDDYFKIEKEREMIEVRDSINEVVNNLINSKDEDENENNVDVTKNTDPRVLFIHANFPKPNPQELKEDNKLITFDKKRRRLYGLDMKDWVGYDFELELWKLMNRLLCELKIEFECFSKINREELCLEVNEQLQLLIDSETEIIS